MTIKELITALYVNGVKRGSNEVQRKLVDIGFVTTPKWVIAAERDTLDKESEQLLTEIDKLLKAIEDTDGSDDDAGTSVLIDAALDKYPCFVFSQVGTIWHIDHEDGTVLSVDRDLKTAIKDAIAAYEDSDDGSN